MSLGCRILFHETGPPAIDINLRNFHKSVSCYLFPEPQILQQLNIVEQSMVRENVKFCHSSTNTKHLY